MFWDYFLWALGIIGVVGIVGLTIWLNGVNEQKKREVELAVAQYGHLERMAMIERGIVPIAETAPERDKGRTPAYTTLRSIGTVAPVFAWLSGLPVAWVAAAIIGSIAAIGVVIVYLPGSSCSPGKEADDSDESEDETEDEIEEEESVVETVVIEEVIVEIPVAESAVTEEVETPVVESAVAEAVETPVAEEAGATAPSGEEEPVQE